MVIKMAFYERKYPLRAEIYQIPLSKPTEWIINRSRLTIENSIIKYLLSEQFSIIILLSGLSVLTAANFSFCAN